MVFPDLTYFHFLKGYKIPYDVYSFLKGVIYVTYCHTNNKIIVYTRNDIEYSLIHLNFNIMLIYGVKGFYIALHAKY